MSSFTSRSAHFGGQVQQRDRGSLEAALARALEQLAAANNELCAYRLVLEELRADYPDVVDGPADILVFIDALRELSPAFTGTPVFARLVAARVRARQR